MLTADELELMLLLGNGLATGLLSMLLSGCGLILCGNGSLNCAIIVQYSCKKNNREMSIHKVSKIIVQ